MSKRLRGLMRRGGLRGGSPRDARRSGPQQTPYAYRVLLWPPRGPQPSEPLVAVGRLEGPGRCGDCGRLHLYQVSRRLAGWDQTQVVLVDALSEMREQLREWLPGVSDDEQFVAFSFDRTGEATEHGLMHKVRGIDFLVAPFDAEGVVP